MLLDPCEVAFGDHLLIQPDGSIEGLTVAGEDMIQLLELRSSVVQQARVRYLTLDRLHEQQPDDPEIRLLYHDAFGFPDDLPNLAALRPPANSRPEGLADCYYQ